MTLFIKQYTDAGRCQTAWENYEWLRALDSGVLLPQMITALPGHNVFRRLGGTIPTLAELPHVAAVIGRMHRAAEPLLAGARLDQRLHASWPVLQDFTESRRAPLHRAAAGHSIDPHRIDEVLAGAVHAGAAFYKDSNLRNFLITGSGIVVLDFDDLTLAPFGYDLAKLATSMAMTFGQLTTAQTDAALHAYNMAIGRIVCTPAELAVWAELNWLLTANYLGRNGYTHPWPAVRPWANPLTSGER